MIINWTAGEPGHLMDQYIKQNGSYLKDENGYIKKPLIFDNDELFFAADTETSTWADIYAGTDEYKKWFPDKYIESEKGEIWHLEHGIPLYYPNGRIAYGDASICYIWGCHCVNDYNSNNVKIGDDLNEFFYFIRDECIKRNKDHCKVYFHNAGWDFEWLLDPLFNMGLKDLVRAHEDSKNFLGDDNKLYHIDPFTREHVLSKPHKIISESFDCIEEMISVPYDTPLDAFNPESQRHLYDPFKNFCIKNGKFQNYFIYNIDGKIGVFRNCIVNLDGITIEILDSSMLFAGMPSLDDLLKKYNAYENIGIKKYVTLKNGKKLDFDRPIASKFHYRWHIDGNVTNEDVVNRVATDARGLSYIIAHRKSQLSNDYNPKMTTGSFAKMIFQQCLPPFDQHKEINPEYFTTIIENPRPYDNNFPVADKIKINENYAKWCPLLSDDINKHYEIDDELRHGYLGGWTYLNPKYEDKIINEPVFGIDENSKYPNMMKNRLYPFDQPYIVNCLILDKMRKIRPRNHRYKETKKLDEILDKYELNLYYFIKQHDISEDPKHLNGYVFVVSFTCTFHLKPNKLPFLVDTTGFIKSDILTDGEEMQFVLPEPLYFLLFEQYDVSDIAYGNTYYFKASPGLLYKCIDYSYEMKRICSEIGDKIGKDLAKTTMNSTYGKFGEKTDRRHKVIYKINEKDENSSFDYRFVYKMSSIERSQLTENKHPYLPIAMFVTGYAQCDQIKKAQLLHNEGRFVYSDTDSLFFIKPLDPLPKELARVLDYTYENGKYKTTGKLGLWKFDYRFKRALFLKKKTYYGESDDNKLILPNISRPYPILPAEHDDIVIKTAGYTKKSLNRLKHRLFIQNLEDDEICDPISHCIDNIEFKSGIELPCTKKRRLKRGFVLMPGLFTL